MLTPRKRLSVVIVTYGRDDCLVESLRCARRALGPDDELIVVDQRPQHRPATRAFLEELARDPQIRILVLDVASMTLARNVGGLAAHGEVLLYLDDDVRFTPDLFERHLGHYRRPEVAGVAGHVREHGDLVFGPPWPYVRAARGANMSFRRDAFLRAGGFDVNFGGSFWGEDTEFSERVRRRAGPIANGPDCVIDHRPAAQAGAGTRRVGDPAAAREWYFHAYHNLFYWLLKPPAPRLGALLTLIQWTRPPLRLALSAGFLRGAVLRAARAALRTRRRGGTGPHWPSASLAIRALAPAGDVA
jgi:GT2 family glycosyltransferase